MMQPDAQSAAVPATTSAPDRPPAHPVRATASETASAVTEALVEEDLLVEDVSIDGMCGVY
jgi:mycofactocin precursor